MGQDYFYQTMILGGLITLNLIFLLSTFIVVKATKMRFSGASIIASLVFTWPTVLGLVTIFPPATESGWVAAFFMLLSLFSYLFWLWFFQPPSLQDMIRANLKEKELESLSLQREGLKLQLSKYGKDKTLQVERDQIKKSLLQNKLMRREVKLNYLKSNLLKKILSRVFKNKDQGFRNKAN